MTYGLAQLISQMAELLADICSFGYDKRDLGRGAVPPRVVAIPTSGRVKEANQSGAGLVPIIGHRVVNIDFHCWAKDLTSAEFLQACVLSATRQILGAAGCTPGNEEWLSPAEAEAGIVVIQTIAVLVAVERVTLPNPATQGKTTRTIDDVDLEPDAGTAGDGSLEFGES